MAHIGVDLHQNAFTVCRLEADGTEAFETWQLCSADLDRFCRTLDADDGSPSRRPATAPGSARR